MTAKLFSTRENAENGGGGLPHGGELDAIECKAKMADHLIGGLRRPRTTRVDYEKHPGRVLEKFGRRVEKCAEGSTWDDGTGKEAVFGWEKKRKEIEGTA